MKIGVDARLLSHEISGINRYSSESLKCMFKIENHNEFYLYSPEQLPFNNWKFENTSLKCKNFKDKVGRFFWSQAYLPYWTNKDNVDVFWSPSHRLPKFLSKKVARVVTIHDLVWKHASKTMLPERRLMESIMMPEAIKSADIIVAVSQSTAFDLKNLFLKIVIN